MAYLLFLFHGETYFNIGHRLGIGLTTVCKCVRQCAYAICQVMFSTHIRLPTTEEARFNLDRWKEKVNIPGIYGAIDTTHITIRKPSSERGSDYIIGRFQYGIKVQGRNSVLQNKLTNAALVDTNKRFLDVEIGWPGSVADSRVFRLSHLSAQYEEVLSKLGTTPLPSGNGIIEQIPAFILGDSAYTNRRHFVTTYTLDEVDTDNAIRRLNGRLGAARSIVENAFALFKARCQLFEKPLRSAAQDLPFAMHLIASACVLHNFLIDQQDGEVSETSIEQQVEKLRKMKRDVLDGDGNMSSMNDGDAEDMQDIFMEPEEQTRQALLRHVMSGG
jgi:DDE superfamily endonuclease